MIQYDYMTTSFIYDPDSIFLPPVKFQVNEMLINLDYKHNAFANVA